MPDPFDKSSGFNGTAHLIARKANPPTPRAAQMRCFNGTAHLIARKAGILTPRRVLMALLQWDRAFDRAEGVLVELAKAEARCFNGTAHLIARKVEAFLLVASKSSTASMGPRI